MNITYAEREKNITTLDVIGEFVPKGKNNAGKEHEAFYKYTCIIDGRKVSLRFTKDVDTKPLENLITEGYNRFKITCEYFSGICNQYQYPRAYASFVTDVEVY